MNGSGSISRMGYLFDGERAERVPSDDGHPSGLDFDEAGSPLLFSPADYAVGGLSSWAIVHKDHDWLILAADNFSVSVSCPDCGEKATYRFDEGG